MGFKDFGSKDWVAISLAFGVLSCLVGTVIFILLNPEMDNVESSSILAGLLEFIVGGLIGYIGGSLNNHRCSECSKKVLFDEKDQNDN
jgi:hypothetical protein